jgi:signal transduction histidine kinase
MNKSSIRTRWAVSLIFLALLPLFVLGLIVSWKSYTVQVDLTGKYQREVARHALSYVELFVHELESVLSMAIKVNNLNSMSHEEIAVVLSKIQVLGDEMHVNLIEELSFIDESGHEQVRIDRLTVFSRDEMRELSSTDVFQNPTKTGQVYYGSILIDEYTGEPFFSMGIPVVNLRSGKANGVLVAKVRLHAAWDMLANIHVGQSGQAYLVDPVGRVVSHKNRSLVLKGVSVGQETEKCNIEKGLEGGYVLRACETFNLGGQKMRLVTDTPLLEALGPTIETIETIVLLLFITFSGAIVLSLLVQRRVIKPIESLAKTANAITEGDLDQRAEVKHEDEIGSLGVAFNTMAARLIETIDSLLEEIKERKKVEQELKEHRNDLAGLVDEATSDLSKSNKKLQVEIKVRAAVEEELNNYKNHLEELVRDRTAELLQANLKLQEETTERKRAREEAAIMEERSRLARELHDSVSQSLYSLTLFAETGRQLVEKEDLENLRICFSEIVSSSQVILKEMRLLMFDLRPAALEEEGLLGALQKRLDSVEQRSGVKSELHAAGVGKLSPALEEGLYRIAQEALNNSLKYSSAKKVTIHITFEDESVEMVVSDDGVGFDSEAIFVKGGIGLTNMKERAAKLGGSLAVSSTLGKGTKITFRVEQTADTQD